MLSRLEGEASGNVVCEGNAGSVFQIEMLGCRSGCNDSLTAKHEFGAIGKLCQFGDVCHRRDGNELHCCHCACILSLICFSLDGCCGIERERSGILRACIRRIGSVEGVVYLGICCRACQGHCGSADERCRSLDGRSGYRSGCSLNDCQLSDVGALSGSSDGDGIHRGVAIHRH